MKSMLFEVFKLAKKLNLCFLRFIIMYFAIFILLLVGSFSLPKVEFWLYVGFFSILPLMFWLPFLLFVESRISSQFQGAGGFNVFLACNAEIEQMYWEFLQFGVGQDHMFFEVF